MWFGIDWGVIYLCILRVEVLDVCVGLGDDCVNVVLVDYEGNVWFGTDSGVMKLVIFSFVIYMMVYGMLGDFVVVMDKDVMGIVWVVI